MCLNKNLTCPHLLTSSDRRCRGRGLASKPSLRDCSGDADRDSVDARRSRFPSSDRRWKVCHASCCAASGGGAERLPPTRVMPLVALAPLPGAVGEAGVPGLQRCDAQGVSRLVRRGHRAPTREAGRSRGSPQCQVRSRRSQGPRADGFCCHGDQGNSVDSLLHLLPGRSEQVVAAPASAAGSSAAKALPAASCAGVMPAASHTSACKQNALHLVSVQVVCCRQTRLSLTSAAQAFG